MSPLPSSSSSKSLRNPSRRTRTPLQEMPLEQFLLPPSSSKLGTSTKRPVSPGTPVLYSPAKRRILNEEGLLTAKAPLSAIASTASATSSQNKQPAKPSQHHYQQQQQQSVARFTHALVGPDSPARKLDFGTPKNAVGSKTPLRQPAEEMLRTLPEAKVGAQSYLRNHEAVEDCFSISSQSQGQTPELQMQPQSLTSHSSYPSSSSSQPPRHLDFLSAPRDVPPPVDPQSEHYPGFAVYQDPYTFIPTLRLTSPALSSTSSATLAPLDDNLDDSDAESIDSRELVKENLPPRKRTHRVSMAPIPEKSQLFSPSSTKSSSVPATPLREHSLREEILTPRRLAIFGVGVCSGLGKAQHTPSQEDRYSMRRILEEEVDGEQSDD